MKEKELEFKDSAPSRDHGTDREGARMRLQIELGEERDYRLPWHYPYLIYSAILQVIAQADPAYSQFLHEKGFSSPDGKSFKAFSFSPLHSLTPPKTDSKGLELEGPLHFILASPSEVFLQAFTSGLIRQGGLTIGQSYLPLQGLELLPSPKVGTSLQFKALSGVVVSTGELDEAGKLLKRYLAPTEPRYATNLLENLKRKYMAFYGRALPEEPKLSLHLFRGFRSKLYRIPGKNQGIRGWLLRGELQGPPEVLVFALDVGLGENTSLGCGFIEPLKGERQ